MWSNIIGITGGGVSSFSPAQVLTGFWRMDMDATVAQIDDQTGNGNHLVQGTAARQGALTGAINSLTALDLDGDDTYLTGINGTGEMSLFFCGNLTNLTALRLIFGNGAYSDPDPGFNWRFLSTGDQLQFLMSDATARDSGIGTASSSIAAATNYILECHFGPGTADVDFRINGALTTDTTARASTGTDQIRFAAANSAGGSGWLGECLYAGISNTRLSLADQLLVREWMANNAGIALS